MDSSTSLTPMPSWQHRVARNKSFNVVQSLFNREMGFPRFSKSSDTISNELNERSISRQLLLGRANLPTNVVSCPVEVNLNNRENDIDISGSMPSHSPQGCFKLKGGRGTKIYYVGGLFWKTSLISTEIVEASWPMIPVKRKKTYSNDFFKHEPDHSKGFKMFRGANRQGEIEDLESFSWRSLDTVKQQCPLYLIQLSEAGVLSATNLSSVSQLKYTKELFIGPHNNGLSPRRRHDMTLNCTEGLIYIVTSVGGTPETLNVISFPPAWSVEMVINVNLDRSRDGNVKMEMCSDMAAFIGTNHMDIVDSQSLINATEDASDANFIFGESGTAKCVRNLKKIPTPMLKIQTMNAYFRVLSSTWPPLCLTKTRTSIIMRQLLDPTPLWTFEISSFAFFIAEPFANGFNSVFVSTEDEQYLVTWTKQTDDPPSYEILRRPAFSFDVPRDPLKRTSERPRLERTCKSASKYVDGNVTRILGVNYFGGSDLVVACANDFGSLLVNLYDPINFQLFKRLQPIQIANPTEFEENSNITKLDKITKVHLDLDYELLVAHVSYQDEPEEIFGIRLLEENTM